MNKVWLMKTGKITTKRNVIVVEHPSLIKAMDGGHMTLSVGQRSRLMFLTGICDICYIGCISYRDDCWGHELTRVTLH